jgi:DNA-binding PadR family transcriptional regulator
MHDNLQAPDRFLPLTFAVFHILLALVDGEKHGYGIILEVEAQTDRKLRLAPGTLYGAISRLRNEGLIEETDERPDPTFDDQRRRYYRLTDLGRRVVVAEAERLDALVRMARAKQLLSSAE